MNVHGIRALALCAAAALGSAAPAARAADQTVTDAAKKEGKLVFYTGIERASAQTIIDGFKKKYPFIAAETIRASSSNNPFDRPPHVQASGIRRDVNQRGLAQLGQAER